MTDGRPHQRLLQLSPVTATPYVEQLSIGMGRRTLAISLAVLITALLLFMLLSFGFKKEAEKSEERVSTVSLKATEIAEEAPKPNPPERTEKRPVPQRPTPEKITPPEPLPPKPAPIIPMPNVPLAVPAPPQTAPPPAAAPVYGPPDKRGASSSRDTQQVGTAPNGEPLYAAAWYREPSPDELSGYLSTATGPGWGLIACRTAPDFRVEDCVGIDEYPFGSQINRAVLAAAWQFRVRPPRVGGRSLVGSWVRIRIDYSIKRR